AGRKRGAEVPDFEDGLAQIDVGKPQLLHWLPARDHRLLTHAAWIVARMVSEVRGIVMAHKESIIRRWRRCNADRERNVFICVNLRHLRMASVLICANAS